MRGINRQMIIFFHILGSFDLKEAIINTGQKLSQIHFLQQFPESRQLQTLFTLSNNIQQLTEIKGFNNIRMTFIIMKKILNLFRKGQCPQDSGYRRPILSRDPGKAAHRINAVSLFQPQIILGLVQREIYFL